MRTTLTLDDDVSKQLEQLRKERQTSLKALVNETLREGLKALRQPHDTQPFQTQTVSLGRCYHSNLDNIGDVLAVAEQEAFK